MKNSEKIMWLAMATFLALAAGCSKSENAGPGSSGTAQATRPETAEPTKPPEQPVAPSTNAVATSTETATTTVVTVVKAADTAVATVTQAAPKAIEAANPATNQTPGPVSPAKPSLSELSQDQMAQGLQDALGKGLQQAIARLGHDGGFLTNLQVRIPTPEKLQKVETALRAMKEDKLADDFIITMNHAAEQAVPEAASVFANALKQLTIQDAKSILSGPDDAATQYFQKTTQTNLYAKFYPIVQKATAKTGVTAAYKSLIEKANVGQGLGSFGSVLGGSPLDKDSLDIDAYVTSKAMDGLFKMVAEEEKQIRQNPIARTTDLMQKVFGALKN